MTRVLLSRIMWRVRILCAYGLDWQEQMRLDLIRLIVVCVLVVAATSNAAPSSAARLGQAGEMQPGRMIEVRLDDQFIPAQIPSSLNRSALRAPTATFSINYLPAGAGLYGDTCVAWPASAQTAFSYAASEWAARLVSSVPITIDACWSNNLGAGILGHGGAQGLYRNFPGAPQTNTWYSIALVNKYYGADYAPSTNDIYIAYSSTYNWYYGTDGATPAGQIDLASVAMHEMAHGLGFTGFMRVDDGNSANGTECNGVSGNGCWGLGTGYPSIYDRFTQDSASNSLINTGVYANPSVALGNALKGGAIYFSGTNANAANGGARVRLYAPATWSSGSSYAHLDYTTYANTPNRLMVYAMSSGASIHDPGPVTIGILKDIGWTFNSVTCYPLITTINPSNGGSATPSTPDCSSQYSTGAAVTIAPSASTDYTFSSWTGCDSVVGATCNVTMNITRTVTANFLPTNDDYNNVVIASGGSYTHTQRIEGATVAGDDPAFPCIAAPQQRYLTVWYRFTAPADGSLSVNTFASNYDTVLAIWTGSRGALMNQGCNNDFAGQGTRSQVGPLAVTFGSVYYIQVASNVAAPASPLTLNLGATFVPTNGWLVALPLISR